MKHRCLGFICLTLAGLLLPFAGQSAEPILLQGKIDDQQKPEPTWYNSRDPEVLNNQILLLNQTLIDTRRIVKNQEKDLKRTTRALSSATDKISSLEHKLKKVRRGKVVEVRDPALEESLNTANAKILALESELVSVRAELTAVRQTPPAVVETPAPTPVYSPAPPANESQELAEMKALVRTYEKAIASLEDELESLRTPEAAQTESTDMAADELRINADELVIPNMEPIVEMAPPAVLEEETPTPSEARIIEDAQQAMDSGDLSRADALFREVLIYNPELVDARLGLASIAYAQNKLESASRQVESILEDYPQQADALGLKGIIHWRSGRSQAAKDFLEQAISLDNQNARLLNFMAIVQDAGGDSVSALATLERAVSVDPDFPEAHFNLAVIEMMRPVPDTAKAAKHYEQSILLGSKRDARLEERLYADR